MRFAAAIVLCASFSGCSSDAAPEPEPTIEDPGAFVAVGGTATLTLFRILTPFHVSGDTVLFATLYDVAPTSFEEAREIAKSHDVPVRQTLVLVGERSLLSTPHRVVWFRTLTDEERKRAL